MKVFCAAMSAPGHAFPMLAVARALAARGHDVTFLSGWEHEPAAKGAGCSYQDFPPGIDGSPRTALRFYDDAASLARALLEPMRALAPDVVVHDIVTLGPALAAEALGIPWATLVIHPLPTPSRDLPPFGLGRRLMPVIERNVRRNVARDHARARDELNAARAALGLARTDRADGGLSPRLIMVATLPALERARSDWPAQAHVIGPCLWDAAGEQPPLPAGDAPLVLIAPSTAHEQTPLLEAAIEAVTAHGARGVLTAGPTAIPAALPSSVVALPFSPHEQLLARCSAVITSGGHGIVARALTHGVPLVIVPGAGDQRENASRVTATGAGVWVRRASARAVGRALRRVLTDPRFRDAAGRLREQAAGLDGPAEAARLVELLGMKHRAVDVERGGSL